MGIEVSHNYVVQYVKDVIENCSGASVVGIGCDRSRWKVTIGNVDKWMFFILVIMVSMSSWFGTV